MNACMEALLSTALSMGLGAMFYVFFCLLFARR